MFERGEDTGDTPGEFQLWVEREHLDQILPLPAGYHHVRLNITTAFLAWSPESEPPRPRHR
jgi:hypothetical protein